MKTILVVDNEPSRRLQYQQELQAEGYEVTCTGDSEEAFRMIAEREPDLIALDFKKDESLGIQFLSQLLKQKKEIPVVLCTPQGNCRQSFDVWSTEAQIVTSADHRELKLAIKKMLSY